GEAHLEAALFAVAQLAQAQRVPLLDRIGAALELDSGEVAAKLAEVEARAIEQEVADGESLPVLRISDGPDEGPVRWRVRELGLAGPGGTVGGDPIVLKRRLPAWGGVCVGSGKPPFGGRGVGRGRFLLYNAEAPPAVTRNRIERMCRALDVPLADLDLHLI